MWLLHQAFTLTSHYYKSYTCCISSICTWVIYRTQLTSSRERGDSEKVRPLGRIDSINKHVYLDRQIETRYPQSECDLPWWESEKTCVDLCVMPREVFLSTAAGVSLEKELNWLSFLLADELTFNENEKRVSHWSSSTSRLNQAFSVDLVRLWYVWNILLVVVLFSLFSLSLCFLFFSFSNRSLTRSRTTSTGNCWSQAERRRYSPFVPMTYFILFMKQQSEYEQQMLFSPFSISS